MIKQKGCWKRVSKGGAEAWWCGERGAHDGCARGERRRGVRKLARWAQRCAPAVPVVSWRRCEPQAARRFMTYRSCKELGRGSQSRA
jgi:hypothetical protein